MMIDRVREYVDAVARELKSGVATEHSYRPCLKALLETRRLMDELEVKA